LAAFVFSPCYRQYFVKHLKIKYMNVYALAQLNELCQMVDRGCKPVALISVRVPEYQKAIDIIYKEYSLHAIGRQLNESFFSIFIFKNYDLRFVIDLLPDEPKTPIDHALLGYLFGYNTDSVCKYIVNHCELNEPNLI
jgi:hypothetical protein